jgi:protein tyrosine phosphatase (PTP) superfamily phosphohydrolase (DUF442 family)
MKSDPAHGANARRGVIAIALLVLVLAVVGTTASRIFLQGNRHVVIPGEIYRSAQPSRDDLHSWAEELELRSVISLKGRTTQEGVARDESARLSDDLDLDLHFVRMSAQRWPSPQELLALIDAIEAAERPLLLHCQAGVDRTGLASAVALMLEGDQPTRAADQFGLAYGYPGRTFGSDLPGVLDAYHDWLESSERSHSPEALRAWVRDEYVAYYYESDYELLSGLEDLAAGRPTTLTFRVSNHSPQTIPLECPTPSIELATVIRELDVSSPWETELRTCEGSSGLAPGDAIVFEVANVSLPHPGRYELIVDLVDNKMDTYFEDMGSPIRRWELRVD